MADIRQLGRYGLNICMYIYYACHIYIYIYTRFSDGIFSWHPLKGGFYRWFPPPALGTSRLKRRTSHGNHHPVVADLVARVADLSSRSISKKK